MPVALMEERHFRDGFHMPRGSSCPDFLVPRTLMGDKIIYNQLSTLR
jgi:hypothetical protein